MDRGLNPGANLVPGLPRKERMVSKALIDNPLVAAGPRPVVRSLPNDLAQPFARDVAVAGTPSGRVRHPRWTHSASRL